MIDEFWLERNLTKVSKNVQHVKFTVEKILEILKTASDTYELENRLITLLGFEQVELIKILRTYRQMSKFDLKKLLKRFLFYFYSSLLYTFIKSENSYRKNGN